MHSTKLFFLLLGFTFLVNSCGLNDGKDGKPEAAYISISAPYSYSVEGTSKNLPINVKGFDNDSLLIPGLDYDIFIDGENKGKLTSFPSVEPGTYQVFAVYENTVSDTISFHIRPGREFDAKEYQLIFHIVHDGEAIGEGSNISEELIEREMVKLHYVFNNQEISLTPNSSSPSMTFNRALTDPEGNELTEPGIHRVVRPSMDHSILFEDWMWDIYWDPDYYINVWVGETKTGYSWGIYPFVNCDTELEGIGCSDETDPQNIEGVALDVSNLGEHNWVFPHEIGHIFGLFHVFNSACYDDPDHAPDTHYYSRTAYEDGPPNVTRVDCDEVSYTSYNVMDYWSQPIEGRDISYDQRVRVRTIVDHGRFRGQFDLSQGTARDMSQLRPNSAAKINARLVH